jgi:hypothetical protein
MSISVNTLIWQKMEKAKRSKDVIFDSPSDTAMEGNGKKTAIVSIQGMEKTTGRRRAGKKKRRSTCGKKDGMEDEDD